MSTRMTIFIKTKFKKSYDQTNIDKYRVAANITDYHIISKLIFLKLIIPKFLKKRRLFHVTRCKKVHKPTTNGNIFVYKVLANNLIYKNAALPTTQINDSKRIML